MARSKMSKFKNSNGATLLEYALLLASLLLICIPAVRILGIGASDTLDTACRDGLNGTTCGPSAIPDPPPPPPPPPPSAS